MITVTREWCGVKNGGRRCHSHMGALVSCFSQLFGMFEKFYARIRCVRNVLCSNYLKCEKCLKLSKTSFFTILKQ